MDHPLRILIVDDSALMRRLIRTMIARDPELVVVGEAADGREALARTAELRPDLITLDVRMPVMDGVETTRQIMAYQPTPILVLTASLSSYDIDITFQMLGAGALDVMEKPRLNDSAALERARIALVRKIKLLARVKVVTHLRGRRTKLRVEHEGLRRLEPGAASSSVSVPPARHHHSQFSTLNSQFPVVVIGASTGGPRVVLQILAGLPAGFGAAVIVVQHIAQGFGAGLVEWMAPSSPMPIDMAEPGLALQAGRVMVAPDCFDLLIEADRRAKLSEHPLLLQRPAIDITMQSVAEVCGAATVGVLLTGMGRDGALGMRSIRRVGGYTIAQDEASCTIFGMPRAAIELGVIDAVLSPDKIVDVLLAHVGARRGGGS
jgi:two-component system chemotaxis response regulator CheB